MRICWDPFHVVALANRALDAVRRVHWNALRAEVGDEAAKRFKGARWALRKRPENLTERQAGRWLRWSGLVAGCGGGISLRRRCGRCLLVI